MNPLAALSRRLSWKLFLSYLVIITVAFVVLGVVAQAQAPVSLAHHAESMGSLSGGNAALVADLYRSFAAAVNEVIAVAMVAATLAAIVVSFFTSGRIVKQIDVMMRASQRIAAGDYRQRVPVASQDELGQLAESFNTMAATLEQTEERRLELIGNVAHELRTPLASIKSVMEGLIDGVLPPEQDTFAAVQREVSRLQRLVGDLQDLSRAEAGQIALDLKPLSPASLVQTVTQYLAPQFQDKGVSLQVDVPPGLPLVRADANRITQVLTNLLGNALQYTPAGGTVGVSAANHAQEVVFTVQDTGIGIAPEHLPHIFERFYRVDKSRSRAGGGSGIGLTIAKHLVEQQGGRISARSAGPSQGSTFTFTLPRAL